MVVQVFDLLQITTLLKSVVFILFLSLMASKLSRYFRFVSFAYPTGKSEQTNSCRFLKKPLLPQCYGFRNEEHFTLRLYSLYA